MSSLNTCVFGTPHGFDSYNVIEQAYYQSMYISSRRGRRLMVNRRSDGTTVYSFLVYNLVENHDRPQSFFGFSFTLDEHQYVTDFKGLYNLCNNEFEFLLAEGTVLTRTEKNEIKYVIDKFSKASKTIDTFISRLLSSLTQSGMEFSTYNASFLTNTSGRIALFNIDTNPFKIIDAMRSVQWVAVSPEFKPENAEIDLNLNDIEEQYTSDLSTLATVAINGEKTSLPILGRLYQSAKETLSLLTQYRQQVVSDTGIIRNVDSLRQKLTKLLEDTTTLINKINTEISTAQQNINIKEPNTRKCPKCGSIKPVSEFIAGNEFCAECRRPKPDIHNTLLKDYRSIIIAATIAIFLIIILIFNFNTDDTFDTKKFQELLSAEEFNKAYDMISETEEFEKYNAELRKTYLATVKRKIYIAQDGYAYIDAMKYPPNAIHINYSDGYDKLIAEAKALDELSKLLNKTSFTDNDRAKANSLLEKLDPDTSFHYKIKHYKDLIEYKPAQTGSTSVQSTSPEVERPKEESTLEEPTKPLEITAYYCTSDYKPITNQPIDINKINLTTADYALITANQQITILDLNGNPDPFRRISEKSIRVHSNETTTGTLTIGDKRITINITKANRYGTR